MFMKTKMKVLFDNMKTRSTVMKSANIKLAILAATISFSLQTNAVSIGSKSNVVIGSKENASVTINKADIENVVIHDVITTDAGIDVSGQRITGLAEGTEGTDSANMNQLNRTDAKATAAQSTADQAIKDAAEKSAAAEKNANNYTDSKIKDSSAQTLIDANAYTDNSIVEVKDEMTSYTDNSSQNTYNKSIDYTNSQINTVNGRIDNLDDKVDENRKKASAGIAGAMAMSSIPQNLSYDFNFGMGMANFDSEQAISAGGYYRVNERTIVSVKASFDTQDNLGAAAGVSYGW
ncbi:hypothetical protein CI266_002479 [Salmonella enterica subsp. enterica serovar Kotte]|nr:hypothetical protein [Salmonella enterica subsp. enterica serovar Kotte]